MSGVCCTAKAISRRGCRCPRLSEFRLGESDLSRRASVAWANVGTVFKVKHFSGIVLIRLLSFEYAKAQMHQLAHCGTEGGHLGLASGKQAFINSFNFDLRG